MNKADFIKRWSDPTYLSSVKNNLFEITDNRFLEGPAELRGLIVGLNGALEEYESLSFEHATIRLIDFTYSKFSCSFSHSRLEELDFSDCLFDTCNMIGTHSSKCHFRSTRISAPTMNDAVFENCDFSNSTLKGRGFYEYGGRRAIFSKCNFRGAKIKSLEFRASKFIQCLFEETIFEKCDLRGAKFEGNIVNADQLARCNIDSTIFS